MFLDPDKLLAVPPAEVLEAAARGHLGLDHRFLHAFLDRPDEALPAFLAFAARDLSADRVNLAPELVALFRQWNTPAALPFLIDLLRQDPENVPDEVLEAIAAQHHHALEPLLTLYNELDESASGEVAFLLASLGVHDPRTHALLIERLAFDFSDTIILLGIYDDPSAIPSVEKAAASLGPQDASLKKEAHDLIQALRDPGLDSPIDTEPFDIWTLYPEKEDLPVDLLDQDGRAELLKHPVASLRAAAARSFFNEELTSEEAFRMLNLARQDPSVEVRARAWEALINSTERIEVVDAMLEALRNPQLSIEERGGLVVGLAPEADRNEVRQAITELYSHKAGRAKALEAMWRSMHAAFRDYFAKHLDDDDLEVQRSAIWGTGYYGVKSALDRLRGFFDHEDLRSDALFAYALALPSDLSRSRMKGLFNRIEKDALGLSEMEEELVKAGLDERLMLAGKEPVFRAQED